MASNSERLINVDIMKLSKASQKSKQETSLSTFQQKTNIPRGDSKKLEWTHPYPGNSLNRYISNPTQRDFLLTLGVKAMRKGLLLDYADVDLMIYLGFVHPQTGEVLSYKTLREQPLSTREWETYRKRLQRMITPLIEQGWLKRQITKHHKAGEVITRRSIELVPLEQWKNMRRPNPPETSKIAEGTTKSLNTYTNQNSTNSDPSVPQVASAKEFIETYDLPKKDSKELENPSNKIRQLQIKVLRSALERHNQRVDYQLWVMLMLCMGFSRTGLKIFRQWIYEPVLAHKPDSFYRILEALQNGLLAKKPIINPGAWLMAEFYAVAGIYRSMASSKPLTPNTMLALSCEIENVGLVKLSGSKEEQISKKKNTPQWQLFKKRIQEELRPEQYEAWFDEIYLEGIGVEKVIFSGIPHPLFRDDIANHHDPLFRKILKEIFPGQQGIEKRKIAYSVNRLL